MTCHNCHIDMVKAGFYGKKRVQRYKCQQCGKRFSEPQQKPFGVDVRLPKEKVLLILNCLVEGNSVRGTARLCGVEKRTVLSILKLAGEKCERLLRERIHGVKVRDLQLDEVWTFVKKKEGHKTPDEANDDSIGDAYTFIGLERHSKLVVAWHLGKRTRIHTEDFLSKVRDATADCWFQVSTDGFQPYINAIDTSLSDRVDYAQLVKVYGKVEEGREARYSPGEVLDAVPAPILGDPDPERICTSHVERKNGTLRQWCKRLTRLTYAFSKRWDNLRAALALHFAHYNFCRQHGSLDKLTPAMAAGVTDHIWTIDELIGG